MSVGVLALQGSFNEHVAVLRRLGVKGVEIRKPEQLQSVSSLIIPGGESTTMAKLAEYHNLFPALREFVKMGKPVWGTCAGLIFLANKAAGQKTGGQELIGGLNCTVHRNFFGSQIQSFEAELQVPEIVVKEGGPPTFRGVFIRAPAILEVGPEVEVLADIPVPSNKTVDPNHALENQETSMEGHFINRTACGAAYELALWAKRTNRAAIISSDHLPPAVEEHCMNDLLLYVRNNGCPERAVHADCGVASTKFYCDPPYCENTGEKVIVAVKQGNLLATAFHPELTADTRWHSYFLKMMGGEAGVGTSAVGEELGLEERRSTDLPIFQ